MDTKLPDTRNLKSTDKVALSVLVVAGLWLFAHPYRGLTHDSILYTFQAVSRLYPGALRGDLFFVYGSQDDYTLFSRLYAWLIGAAGLENAMRLVVAGGQALWLYAAWRVSAVLPSARRLAFLALLAALPGAYATDVFGYGEMFATARIVTEALTLAALAAILRGRFWLSALLMALAATQHPLMAGGGILLLLLYWGLRSPRRLTVGVLSLFVATAAVLAALGLHGRLATMDPQWFMWAKRHNADVFMSTWHLADWNLLILNFCALAAGWRFCTTPDVRRLMLAALLTGLCALMACLIGDLFWHCQLLIQMQPMRFFWLVKWLAVLAFATLLRRKKVGPWIPLFLAAAWFTQSSVGGVLAAGALFLTCSSSTLRLRPLPRWIWLPMAAAAVSWLWYRYSGYLDAIQNIDDDCDGFDTHNCLPPAAAIYMIFMRDMGVFLGVAGAWFLHALWDGRFDGAGESHRTILCLKVFAFAVFGVGIGFFSMLSVGAQPYFVDRDGHGSLDDFARRVPPQATVYWPDHLVYTWYYLGRKSYYSRYQSAGAVFSRAATVEMKRRADRTAALGSHDSIWDFRTKKMPVLPSSSVRRGLTALCGDRNVDYVVLKNRFAGLAIAEWTNSKDGKKWRLYDCRKVLLAGNADEKKLQDSTR